VKKLNSFISILIEFVRRLFGWHDPQNEASATLSDDDEPTRFVKVWQSDGQAADMENITTKFEE
jgi:hypothetical protein